MSNFDKALHLIGSLAAGAVVASTAGLAIPPWLVAACAVVAYSTGALAGPLLGPPRPAPPAPPSA